MKTDVETIESAKVDEIKKALDTYNGINVLPSPDLRQDSFPAALAIFFSLKKAGKNVNIISQEHPMKYQHLSQGNNQPDKNSFVISVKEDPANITEISYERTNQGLDLVLKTKAGAILAENISLKPLAQGDLLITVGIADINSHQVQDIANLSPEFIINIDNQKENKKFGDINLVDSTAFTLSEAVFDFLCCIDNTLASQDCVNALFSGISQEIGTLNNPNLSPRTLQTLSCLLEQGAQIGKTGNNFYELATEKSLRVFGRIISKIHIDKPHNLAWILLKATDFLKTNSSPTDLKFALRKLTTGFYPFEKILMLWEQKSSPAKIHGIFYSPDRNQLERIAIAFEGQTKGKGVMFKTQENDLRVAKNIVFTILEE